MGGSIDDLFSSDNKVEVNVFGNSREMDVKGEYPLPNYLISLIKENMKYGQHSVVMENAVFVYSNGIIYKWAPSHLEIVIPK